MSSTASRKTHNKHLLTARQSFLRLLRKANGSWRDAGTSNGGYRAQPTRLTDPPAPEQLLEIAARLGMRIARTLPPNTPGACSGKYMTYLMRDPMCQTSWKFVCGKGGNVGHKFEHEVLRSFKSMMNGTSASSGKKYPAGMKMARQICRKFGITNPKAMIASVAHVAQCNTNRQIGFLAKPSGVGSQIADICLKTIAGKTYYISLKAQNAATIASIGAVGAFKQSGNKIIQTDKHQTVNNLLSYLGVDLGRLTSGLTNAKNKTRTKLARSSMVLVQSKVGSTHSRLLRQFLVNAIGFGYHAASQKIKGKQVENAVRFISRKTTATIVGSQLKKIELSYPRYYSEKDSSKQLSAWVTTNKARFKIELRNTHGKILPREVKVTICKLHDAI